MRALHIPVNELLHRRVGMNIPLVLNIQFGNASWCVVCLSALLIFIYLLKVLFGELLQLPVTSLFVSVFVFFSRIVVKSLGCY